jgi:hypothetical protein
VDRALRGIKLIQGQAKVSRSLVIHRGQEAPPTTGDSIPVWIRDGFSSTEKAMTDASISAGMDSPTIFVFIPRKSRDELLSAVSTAEAARQTVDAKGAPGTQEGQLAKQALESRRDLAVIARDNLVKEIVGAAKVIRGGGSEVFGITLDAKLKAAAEDSLVRLFPQFNKADAPSAAWENCIKRARAAHEQPFQPLKYEGPIEQHPVCQQVRQSIGSGKTGTQTRKELEASPFGWPRDAVDAALIALHSSQQLVVTLNGTPIERGQLDQNRIPKAEFRLEKTNVSLEDRLKLRKLFQKMDINCKSGEETEKAPDFIQAVVALAGQAGGDAPLPSKPSVSDVEAVHALVGNERLAGLRDISDSVTARIAEWKKTKALIAQREPAWKTLERLEAQAGTLSSVLDARKQIQAIRLERRLLDSTDPLPSLKSELTEQLRKALNAVQSAHETAYTAGLAQLSGNATWQKLKPAQQQTMLQNVGLTAPPKADTGTDLSILAALDQRNLATRTAEADAVSGRVSNALKEFARWP